MFLKIFQQSALTLLFLQFVAGQNYFQGLPAVPTLAPFSYPTIPPSRADHYSSGSILQSGGGNLQVIFKFKI